MFKLPKDMKYFKESTTNKIVVMGANTFKSLPNNMPLKNRLNIVLQSSEPEEGMQKFSNLIFTKSFNDLLKKLKGYPSDDVFVIGGARMYKALLPYCKFAYITKVDADGGADTFIENLDNHRDWKIVKEGPWINDNGHKIQFDIYKNKSVKSL